MPSYSIGLIHTFLKEKISFEKEKKNCFKECQNIECLIIGEFS